MSLSFGTALALAAYLALILVPGLVLLRLAGWPTDAPPDADAEGSGPADPWVRLGLAAGLGLALQPLAYLWARLAGLPVDAGLVRALLLALAAGLALASWRRGRRPADLAHTIAQELRRPSGLAMTALLGLLLAARWWALRDLSVPMFGDSLHHSMIVRLFALQDGLPRTWRPFAELSTFSYHFGLHAGAASLAALTGISAPRAIIVGGQALMLLQALTAYALVAGLSGRRWAGLGAALAAGGLGTMPGFYANWGRYTQLAGQVLLPASLLATAWAVGDDRPAPAARWRRGLLAALTVAGLALTHYIVTLLYALAVLAWLAFGVAGGWRARRAALVRLAAIAAAAVLLALPWIPSLLAGPLDESAVKLSTERVADPAVYGVVSPWQIWNPEALGRNLGGWLLAALLAGGLYGLWRRERLTRIGLCWAGLIALATYPQLLGLPITGPLKDFTVAIGAYLPAALVIGGGLGALAAGLGLDGEAPRTPASEAAGGGLPQRWRPWLLAGLLILVAGARAWQDRDLLDPAFQLVHPADEAAMAWIRANTPPDARFLVGSFAAFGDTVQAGDDAGWWLPLLAEPRSSTLPPITYGIERGYAPDYRLRVNALAALWQADLDGAASRAALAEAGVTHAYVGVSGKALDRGALAASPYWRRVHAEAGAEVYRRLDQPADDAVEPASP
ncbi:MAG: hypothetical protein H6648_09065 [Caldilineae bacterium]|nr:hypothetical protein [Chloroflexota bacterium]MCB9177297.1 hypothetical protein [Caldilineae bacterium]